MKSRITENPFLRKALHDVYLSREKEGIGDDWPLKVMQRVRRIGPLRPASSFWPAFEHVVWRLAPVSCFLIVLLTVLLLNMDFGVGNDYLGTVTVDLEEPTLTELFGFEG